MAEPAPISLEQAWARFMRTLAPRNTALVSRNRIIVSVLRGQQKRGAR